MARFEPRKAELEEVGQVIFIAAQKRGGVFNPESFLQKHPVSFPYLLDEDREVTKAFGVYKALGVDSINIARPASFVIDQQGVVTFIYVGMNQMDRIPVEMLLRKVRDPE